MRLWLRDPEYAWPTAPALKKRWEKVYEGVTAEKSVFPLEPRIRSASDGLVKNGDTAQKNEAGSH